MSISRADQAYMRLALTLARRGQCLTRPNPMVGAVLVKHGRILARGFHRRAGLPHAEIEALARVGFRAPGATLYVTLEPCCHRGRTDPCTERIIASGTGRVVVGCRDENPLVDGRGIAQLQRAGLAVEVGCLEEECRAQNRCFFRWVRDRRPFVTLKVASSLDGFIAPGGSAAARARDRWITGARARHEAHRLRAAHDAVLVGAGTVLADDPRLTVRPPRLLPRGASPPLRVVLDGRLRTPPTARLLRTPRGGPRPLVVGALPGRTPAPRELARRARALERAGAEVLLLPGSPGRRLPIRSLLRTLAARGVQSLLVEGGSRVFGAFLGAGAVDAVAWFLAPRLLGGGVPAVRAVRGARARLSLGGFAVRFLDGDMLISADHA